MKLFRPILSIHFVTAICALYFVCVFNIRSFQILFQYQNTSYFSNWLFIGNFSLSLFLLLWAIFSLLCAWPYWFRPFTSIIILISSLVAYGGLRYQAVFDHSMIDNLLNTNPVETSMYINFSSISWFLLTGVLPVVFLWMIRISYGSIKTFFSKKNPYHYCFS
ncbi:DUF1705 domain-containing protein [Suttonella ornithocola]|uniref:phosphoethanolamine transferase domain-containing protein n=1 Tax=Suttonella ornithocola TaxID=279832 RepID=UPI000932B7A9